MPLNLGTIQIPQDIILKITSINYLVADDNDKRLVINYDLSGQSKHVELSGADYNVVADTFVTWAQYANYILDLEGYPQVDEQTASELFLNDIPADPDPIIDPNGGNTP